MFSRVIRIEGIVLEDTYKGRADPIDRRKAYSRIAFWIPTILSLALIFSAEKDIFHQYPIVGAYVEFISDIAPSLKEWAKNSPSPVLTLITISSAWSVIPYWTIFFLFDKRSRVELEHSMRIDGKCLRLYPFGLMVFFTINVPFFFYYMEDGAVRWSAAKNSIILQFLMANFNSFWVSYSVSHMFLWPKIYMDFRKSSGGLKNGK
jgi:hypothetical protein